MVEAPMTDPTPTEPTPTEPTPTEPTPPRGLRGWLQRRGEAMLRKPHRALPALTQPGECQVVLQLPGANVVRVVMVIAEATGLDFVSASKIAGEAPAIVVSGISEASAELVVERLEKAGAKAVVGEQYRPQ